MDRVDVYAMCPLCDCRIMADGEVIYACPDFMQDAPCQFANCLEEYRVYAWRLHDGAVAVIDLGDKPRVFGYSWRRDRHGHVLSDIDGRKVLLHRLALNVTDPGVLVDHKAGDKLDNRKSQLREATTAQNRHNTRKVRGSSAYLGVYWSTSKQRWAASIQAKVEGTRVNRSLGLFDTEVAAATAYDQAARAAYGEFAKLNFPRG